MNIHIDNDTAKELFKKTIASIVVGSRLYGIETEDSDIDILCVYMPNEAEAYSCVQSNHQFQYTDKINNRDYLFTSLSQFFRNIISGDSTINFEALFAKDIGNSVFKEMLYLREELITYNLVKSYLGMAKRDLKQIRLQETDSDKWNKLAHVKRGADTAKILMHGGYYNPESGASNLLFLKTKTYEFDTKFSRGVRDFYTREVDDLRSLLNERLDKGLINKTPNDRVLRAIDNFIITKATELRSENSIFDENRHMKFWYDAMCKGIKYE